MKKVAIMQPYFFPYLGYFSLIKNTDEFILFDPVQFIRHGWIERNRILKQEDGWLYIKVPLMKHGRGILIKDIQIDNSQDWRGKIKSQLQPYNRIAPYYHPVMSIISKTLDREFSDIVTLNKVSLEEACKYLGIYKKELPIFSKMKVEIDPPKLADEWALNICKAIGDIDEYWNPYGGEGLFDRSKYEAANIKIKFQKVNIKPYDQKRAFVPGLSIIDVMMFNSPEEISKMLDSYELS